MKLPPRSTFSRHALVVDAISSLGVALFIVAAGWSTLHELNQKYLDLRIAEAAGIPVFLESHIARARQKLLDSTTQSY